jgi:hypothetical protein
MFTDPNQVQGPDGGVPAEGTPAPSEVEVPAEGTPAQLAQPDVEKVRAEYEQKVAQMQQDLNNMKSSLQKREYQQSQQYQQQVSDLQKQLREVRMQGMDETQRKAYEVQLQAEEYQTLQQRLEEQERKNQEFEQMLGAQDFFIKKGVPADKLILNQGYETLVQSGWDWVSERLAQLQQQVTSPTKQEPAPLKTAPGVVTDKGLPASGSTWTELRKLYGSDENVYRLIEQGTLSPSILPR